MAHGQGVPPEKADELAAGYQDGQDIVLILSESSHGKHNKTAFSVACVKPGFSIALVLKKSGPLQ